MRVVAELKARHVVLRPRVKILRSVIVLDPTLKIDEVDISYRAFIEQYKGHIIRRIIRDKGWTITKAANYLASKFMYDDYVYGIMCDIVREEEPKLILNRNPRCKLWDVNHVNCGEGCTVKHQLIPELVLVS